MISLTFITTVIRRRTRESYGTAMGANQWRILLATSEWFTSRGKGSATS